MALLTVRFEWMLSTKALGTWGASCRPQGGAGQGSLLLRLGGKETARTWPTREGEGACPQGEQAQVRHP